jgi:hypothetical protein
MANYPSSSVLTLSRDISDHCPCLIAISIDIPKSKVFRFENHWLLHEEFMNVLQHGWTAPGFVPDRAKLLGAKFKNLRNVLSLQEWNFRKVVQDHLMSLLEQQRIYWQQRGRIKSASLGDESTKFFHANATIRHNKNVILSLRNEAGEELFKHEEKVELLWQSYKPRLGTSEFT